MKGWMYILKCVDDSYYVGSTKNLEMRFAQHQSGVGANHTAKRLPVQLVYAEEYERIDLAFAREKQVQKWRRAKKEALICGEYEKLPELAKAYTGLASSTSFTSTSSVTDTLINSVTDTSTSSVTDTLINSVTDSAIETVLLPKVLELVESSAGNTQEVHS